MRFFLLLTLAVLATGCMGNGSDTDYHVNHKSALVNEISNTVFKELKNKINLYPIECGGRMMDQITLLHWGFFYYKDINTEEARELLMTATNQFLDAFNADERIRPYLATYPFKPENIEIRIFLKKPDGSELESDKLHAIAIIEGTLDYMIRSSENERLKTIHEETYNEAASKLNTGASPNFSDMK